MNIFRTRFDNHNNGIGERGESIAPNSGDRSGHLKFGTFDREVERNLSNMNNIVLHFVVSLVLGATSGWK